MTTLELYLHENRVGTVAADPRDNTRVLLEIDRDYVQEVVLSESFAALPGRRPDSSRVSNFLGGYVPEGNHRAAMAAIRRVAPDDLFALLREFGGSVAGAVTLRVPGAPSSSTSSYEALDDRALARRLRQALDDSDQGIPDDSRSTLPGYQPKVLVAWRDGGWQYPHGRAHSTHILKPQVPTRPTRIIDEFYSHELTRRMGLSSFRSELRRAGAIRYLAIERFDRAVVDGHVVLHHQEDLAQALGIDWRDTDVKFQDPDWPTDPKRATAARIAELLGSIPGGGRIVEQWLRQLTYHVAIGNNDGHAKNVALLHLHTGTELTQLYDAVPNLFQSGLLKWDLALAIDGVFDHRRMSIERLVAEARSWGVIAPARSTAAVIETLDAFDDALGTVKPPRGISDGLGEQLRWNVDRLRAGDEIGRRKGATGGVGGRR